MPAAAVAAAVETKLAAEFSAAPVRHPNQAAAEPPADGGIHVVVEYPLGLEEPITVGAPGSNIHRETGVIRLVVHAPRATGSAAAFALVDQLRGLFRAKRFGGVVTDEASPAVVDEAATDGGTFVVSTAITYQFDAVG